MYEKKQDIKRIEIILDGKSDDKRGNMFEKLVKFYFFVDKTIDSYFRTWIISSLIILGFMIFDENFDIYSVFASMIIGVFFVFVLLPFLLLIHFIIEKIIYFYWDDEEKRSIFLYYDKIRSNEIKKEIETIKKNLGNSK